MKKWVKPVAVLSFVAAIAGAGHAKPLKPPVARRADVIETTFGLTVHDPYRWMEQKDSAEFKTWLTAQGDYGAAQLETSPALAVWQKRFASATGGVIADGGARRVNGLLFFSHIEKGLQAVTMVRYADGSERVLFDPNTAGADGQHVSVTRSSISPDGTIIALDVDHGGNEITDVEFYDTHTGSKLPDFIKGVWGEERVNWAPDSKSLLVTALAEDCATSADPTANSRVLYHIMGTPPAADQVLLKRGMNPNVVLEDSEFPKIYTPPQSDWAMLTMSGARSEERVCVIRKTDLLKPGAPYRCIAEYADSIQDAVLRGDTLYFMTMKATPNRSIIAVDLTNPAATLKDAQSVLDEKPDIVLTGLAAARDALYVQRMSKGLNDFVRVDWSTRAAKVLSMPYGGSAYSAAASQTEDGIIFGLDSWNKPAHGFTYDPTQGAMVDLKMAMVVPKTYPDVEVVDMDIRSRDGTPVPISILRPRGMKLNGRALVVLDGYAAYGVSTQPFFDPTTLEWVSAGHVYVYVSARGGGEKGEAWHLAGKGPLKYKGAEDMIAASDAMVAMHYADYGHIAMNGASAGGTLVGQAMTMAPDHFGAVIIHAGEVNPSRLAVEPNGPNQYGEFGDARTAEGFKALYDMDPYLHVKSGTVYPPLMLEIGLNDNRVTPWNSGKFGAAVLAASPANRVLFNIQSDTGHFGTSLNQYTAQAADHFTFFEMAMPLTKTSSKQGAKRHR